MNKFIRLLTVTACSSFLAAPMAMALDVDVAPSMQVCTTDEDCTLADGQCGNSCGFVPVNTKFVTALQSQKTATCGAPSMENEANCQTVPPLKSSCIHNRCTLGTAYQEHGDHADYGGQPRETVASHSITTTTTTVTTPPDPAADAPAAQPTTLIRPFEGLYQARDAGDSSNYAPSQYNDEGASSAQPSAPRAAAAIHHDKDFDDRHGYTAYDLPDQGAGTVKELGTTGD